MRFCITEWHSLQVEGTLTTVNIPNPPYLIPRDLWRPKVISMPCWSGSGGWGSSCSPDCQELRRFLPDRGVGGLRGRGEWSWWNRRRVVTGQCNGLTVWLIFKDGMMPATCKMKGRHSGWVPHRHAISVPRIDVFCVFAAPVGLSVTGGCANLTFWLPPV